jgi:hypothetical protein
MLDEFKEKFGVEVIKSLFMRFGIFLCSKYAQKQVKNENAKLPFIHVFVPFIIENRPYSTFLNNSVLFLL